MAQRLNSRSPLNEKFSGLSGHVPNYGLQYRWVYTGQGYEEKIQSKSSVFKYTLNSLHSAKLYYDTVSFGSTLFTEICFL